MMCVSHCSPESPRTRPWWRKTLTLAGRRTGEAWLLCDFCLKIACQGPFVGVLTSDTPPPPPRANQENRYFCALVPFASPLENGERANVERIANLNIGTLCASELAPYLGWLIGIRNVCENFIVGLVKSGVKLGLNWDVANTVEYLQRH